MQTVQGTSSAKIVTSHAMFLANVSRHFVSLEIEPMLEAVGRSALCVLGDICVVDRIWGAASTRILEVRATQDAWIEASSDLASVTRGEVRLEGERSRISVPIGTGADRFGAISFAKNDGNAHSAADLALAQELGDRLAMAIRNVREHKKLVDALGDRERLISIAAHELRGPLCSVRLCLQSLQAQSDAARRQGEPNGGNHDQGGTPRRAPHRRSSRSRTDPVGTARARPDVLRPLRAGSRGQHADGGCRRRARDRR